MIVHQICVLVPLEKVHRNTTFRIGNQFNLTFADVRYTVTVTELLLDPHGFVNVTFAFDTNVDETLDFDDTLNEFLSDVTLIN